MEREAPGASQDPGRVRQRPVRGVFPTPKEDPVTTLIDPRELVGSQEAATITGMTDTAFRQAHSRDRVPEPITVLACGPIWTRSQIEEWTANRAAERPS